ncbi:MAG: hypothetical protein HY898_07385 [Deltaproteobacteria bacterium]|nr:hypothetical protein [Deltaproteobacteria bacterium]
MIRPALGMLAAGSVALVIAGSCSPPPPKPLDVSSYPSATTSAEPLFISNAPSKEAGAPSASAPAPAVPAPSASAPADGWK